MRSSPDENIQTAISQTPSSIYPTSTGNDSSHKRKRSGTHDAGRSSPLRQYDYSPPKRGEHPQHLADRALHALGSSGEQPRESRPTERREEFYTNGTNHDDHTWDQEQAGPAPRSTNGSSEEHWEASPVANGHGYDSSMNGANGVVPKRKRNFSNRTKTGCMTCRRRKKKCDETHPQCKLLPCTRITY
jgi:hypothetical protein